MSRSLKLLTASYIFAAALVFVPSAFATANSGEGIWGPTGDVTVMYAMFSMMGIIVLIIIVFTLIQSWLDHRKHARLDAAKAHSGHPEELPAPSSQS